MPPQLLYRRDVACAHLADLGSWQKIVFNLESTELNKVLMPDLSGIVLRVGESATLLAPAPGHLTDQFSHADRLANRLMMTLHVMSLAAASQASNGRATATGKAIDREPLVALQRSVSEPLEACLERIIKAVKGIRGEPELEVNLLGFDEPAGEMRTVQELVGASRPPDVEVEVDGDGAEAPRQAPSG